MPDGTNESDIPGFFEMEIEEKEEYTVACFFYDIETALKENFPRQLAEEIWLYMESGWIKPSVALSDLEDLDLFNDIKSYLKQSWFWNLFDSSTCLIGLLESIAYGRSLR